MYDIAKDYYIYFDILSSEHWYQDSFHCMCLLWHIKNSLKFKTRYPWMGRKIRIRCGKKKLNRIIKEIIFLGFDEDAFIEEVEK